LSHAYASQPQIDEGVHQQLLKGKAPISIRFSNTWREDGLTSKKFQGNRVSFYYFGDNPKSRNPGFAEKPKTTWFTVNPLTSNCNYITWASGSAIKGSMVVNQFQFLYRR
jgi:hypothetical protein